MGCFIAKLTKNRGQFQDKNITGRIVKALIFSRLPSITVTKLKSDFVTGTRQSLELGLDSSEEDWSSSFQTASLWLESIKLKLSESFYELNSWSITTFSKCSSSETVQNDQIPITAQHTFSQVFDCLMQPPVESSGISWTLEGQATPPVLHLPMVKCRHCNGVQQFLPHRTVQDHLCVRPITTQCHFRSNKNQNSKR